MKLTDQQQAIVQHRLGPGLVFAVAGSGKTTSMVHRIKHLIDKKVVHPHQILATSFNNAAVKDIISQLSAIGVSGKVDCRTLHSLGYRIVRSAIQQNYLHQTWLGKKENPGEARSQLINQTIVQMAIEQGVDSNDLGIDREDLKNQISIWKSNLAYADLEQAELPLKALKFAEQAAHPHPQYLLAYQTYEQLRVKQKILTFDDMLMTGWEILMRFPDILKAAQSAFQLIMVDEFQDVNYAQYQMLDLIIQPHRNYMAIGDDDQCIYQWRGANPQFILNFEKTYGAKVYTISDNFRSTAQQIVLANRIIHQNQNRYPKRLNLTRGFKGNTVIHPQKNDAEIAGAIVKEIQELLAKGDSMNDMVVLIRLYSQTAFIETELIARQIPYKIEGNEPFYKRRELIPLFQYLSFAQFEKDIRKNGFPNDPKKIAKYLDIFKQIINKPRRYVAKDFLEVVVKGARRKKCAALKMMLLMQENLKPGSLARALEFADTINMLIPKLRRPAHKTLKWLVEQIQYEQYLLDMSGMYEIGLTRLQNVEALIEFAKTKGKCGQFLEYIRDITINPIPNPQNIPPLKIMTIYRAKGLEWETVFVPGCNEGLFPCLFEEGEKDPVKLAADIEAERRLFYVAITRVKKALHLYHSVEKTISPFLSDVNAQNVLDDVNKMQKIMANKRLLISQTELVSFCRHIIDFHLERYFTLWMNWSEETLNIFRDLLAVLAKKIERAEKEFENYQTDLNKYKEEKKGYSQRIKKLRQEIRNRPIIMRKFKSAFRPVKVGQYMQFELFEDGDIMLISDSCVIGVVEFNQMPGFDRQSVIWETSCAIVEKISDSGMMSELKFTRVTYNRNHRQAKKSLPVPPQKLPDKTLELLDPGCRKGMDVLKRVIVAKA